MLVRTRLRKEEIADHPESPSVHRHRAISHWIPRNIVRHVAEILESVLTHVLSKGLPYRLKRAPVSIHSL